MNAMRIVTLDNSGTRSPEPYVFLAEILVRKAEDKKLGLVQRQQLLLQAAALLNFVRNYLKTKNVADELSQKLSSVVSRTLYDIQDNLVAMAGGNPLHCKFDSKLRRKELEILRNEVKKSLESIECRWSCKRQGPLSKNDVRQMLKDQAKEIKCLCETISAKMKQFLATIINESLEVLETPPCDYEVIVLGSLARNEVTPFSDFEWAILTSSEEEECKAFFRHLTNLVHLQVGQTLVVA